MVRTLARTITLFMLCALPGAAQTGPPITPAHSQPAAISAADRSKLQSDALLWLQDLIRINTTNPPGNELVAAKYIEDVLKREGINSEIFESAPGRGFIVARLSASAVPDPSRALLLMAHLDVVGVDKSKWSVDPFGAVIKDGYLYGRGAIDDKGMLAANLAVFVLLKRSGARLNRDVIFLAEGDEEAGGTQGMAFAVEKHWDKIAAGYALNEGGHIAVKDGKIQYVGIQASEKVSVNVDLIATGTSGHSSLPRKDNAVTHLAAAAAKIGSYEAPAELNAITRAYFSGLAAAEDDETAKWMRALDTSDRGEHAARWLSSASPYWNAMLHDTVTPTMLQAGIRANVVPSEARGVVNVRLLPGNSIDALIGKLQTLVNDPQIRFQVQPGGGQAAPSTSTTSDLYAAIARAAAREFPGATVVPLMSTGATDSMPLRLRTVRAYGVLPFPLAETDSMRMHADDERIPLDSFGKGVDFLCDVVADFAIAK